MRHLYFLQFTRLGYFPLGFLIFKPSLLRLISFKAAITIFNEVDNPDQHVTDQHVTGSDARLIGLFKFVLSLVFPIK